MRQRAAWNGMALDAFVYCDCFERNRLLSPPPDGVAVSILPSGELCARGTKRRVWDSFVNWRQKGACQHEGTIFLHRCLGSEAEIAALRGELLTYNQVFSVLTQNVLYSGTHTCDWIAPANLPALASELDALARLLPERAHTPLRTFHIHMSELLVAAKHTGKTICF